MELKEQLSEMLESIDLSELDNYELEDTIAGCGVGTNRDSGTCSGSCGSGTQTTCL